jgi:type II secretory pathway pseudopilin PulG
MITRLPRAIERFRRAMRLSERGAISLPEILVGLAILVVISVWVLPNLLGQRTKGVDGGIRNDINSMMIAQETVITDNPTLKGVAYTSNAWVSPPGGGYTMPSFKATTGNDIEVQLTTTGTASKRGYCIRGSNPDGSVERDGSGAGHYYWYDSALGGLQTSPTKPTGGACEGTTL